jgi:hypothetical protein
VEKATSTILIPSFWNQVTFVARTFTSLVHLLRIADIDEKPYMDFVCGGFEEIKEMLVICNGNELSYEPFKEVI